MKKLFFLCSIIVLAFSLSYGQKPEVIIRIEEDYTNPIGRHYEKSTEFVARKIEEGVYKSEATNSSINAELTFGYKIEQRNCFFENDAEFELLKTGKSKPADFIGVKFKLNELKQYTDTSNSNSNAYEYDLEYYWFYFNNEGKWKLMKGNGPTEVQSGTITTNPEKNILKVEHLPNQTNLYLNGNKACEIKTTRIARLKWNDISITAESNKTKIGLDKAVWTGYFNKKNPPMLDSDVYGMSAQSFDYVDGLAVKPPGSKKIKYMDNWGRIKGNAEFDEVYTSQNKAGMLWAKNDGLYGYINFEGNWAVQPIYTEASKSECFGKDACLPGYFKVKNAEGKEFLVNAEGKVVPLENGKLAAGYAATTETLAATASTGNAKPFELGPLKLSIYKGWYDVLTTTDFSKRNTVDYKNCKSVLAEAPDNWVKNEGMSGMLEFTWEANAGSYDAEKKRLIDYYTGAKTNFSQNESERSKAAAGIKPLEGQFTLPDGKVVRTLFYCDAVPVIGFYLWYAAVITEADNKSAGAYEIKLKGATAGAGRPDNFKEWNDYLNMVFIEKQK